MGGKLGNLLPPRSYENKQLRKINGYEHCQPGFHEGQITACPQGEREAGPALYWGKRTRVLLTIADAIEAEAQTILAANREDVEKLWPRRRNARTACCSRKREIEEMAKGSA